MQLKPAEQIALKALTWLLENDDLLPAFMEATGTGEADFRLRTGDSEFLLSVLDFITMNDSWVIAFCDSEALPYLALMQARQAFPGGTETSWT